MATQFSNGAILPAVGLNAAIVDVGAAVNFTPSVTVNLTTFQTVTNALCTFTKGQASTRLMVFWTTTGYATTVGFSSFIQIEFAMRVDAVDNVAGFYNFNFAVDHRQMAGMCLLTGLSAGAKTLQLRARIFAQPGGANMICDSNDRGSIFCFEIPA